MIKQKGTSRQRRLTIVLLPDEEKRLIAASLRDGDRQLARWARGRLLEIADKKLKA